MRLVGLDPCWIVQLDDRTWRRTDGEVDGKQKQGCLFLCPKCFAQNGGPIGTHSIIVPFANPVKGPPMTKVLVGDHHWHREGESFETLTLSPSYQVVGGCAWHGHVHNGEVTA